MIEKMCFVYIVENIKKCFKSIQPRKNEAVY